jgi:hypothetical protein
MPVLAQTIVNRTDGNGITTVFPYGFRILSKSDLVVTVGGVVLTVDTDYTVDGVGAASGGNVTLLGGAPAVDVPVIRYRSRAYSRSTDYVRNGSFKEETVDADFDSLEMQVQQIVEEVDRSIRIPIDDAISFDELPVAADRASMLLGFDSNGEQIQLYGNANDGLAFGTAGEASGAALIGFLQEGTGAVARTAQSKMREIVSVMDFGATGDGVTDDTAAVNAAINYVLASPNNNSLYFPAGKYIIDTIALDSERCVIFHGEGGFDPVSSYGKTWIYWKSGSTADHLLAIKSCAYIHFENINFFSNGNSGKTSLVEFQCNGQSTAAPRNKFANTAITFDHCAFVVTTSASMSVATVNLKSALQTNFKHCLFFGDTGIKLGKDTDVDPITAEITIPEGRAVLTRFERCSFRGNIVRERVLGVEFDGSYFAENSVPFGADYRISFMSVSGNQEVRNELIIGCVADTANVTRNVNVWYEGPATPAVTAEPSLVAIGNQLNGAGVIFDIKSGVASIEGNKFLSENMPGVTAWRAIRIGNGGIGIKKIKIGPNDYDGVIARNSASAVASAVEDLRSNYEDDSILLARGIAADLTLSSNSYTQVLSRTLDYVEGGVYELSYHLTISSAIDATFTGRLLIDGVAIPGSYARYTTNTASAKTFVLTLSARLAPLAATILSASRVLELQIKQETGSTYAVIRGDSYVLSDTFALVRRIH